MIKTRSSGGQGSRPGQVYSRGQGQVKVRPVVKSRSTEGHGSNQVNGRPILRAVMQHFATNCHSCATHVFSNGRQTLFIH